MRRVTSILALGAVLILAGCHDGLSYRGSASWYGAGYGPPHHRHVHKRRHGHVQYYAHGHGPRHGRHHRHR